LKDVIPDVLLQVVGLSGTAELLPTVLVVSHTYLQVRLAQHMLCVPQVFAQVFAAFG
jgi:hypothetical protein